MSGHIRCVLQQCLLGGNGIQNNVKIVPYVIETIGKLKLFKRIEASPEDVNQTLKHGSGMCDIAVDIPVPNR